MGYDDTVTATRTKMALATHQSAGLVDIEVVAVEGVVYLRGEVESHLDRKVAERVAASVEGVKAVHNQLRVRRVERPSIGEIELPGDGVPRPKPGHPR